MIGIKAHTREYRRHVIAQLLPMLRKKFGDNLVAFASDGSYARGEDTEYSDLEVMVFLREIPKDLPPVMHKIIDGMLVVVVFDTKENCIKEYLDVSGVWYASGVCKLQPIVNSEYLKELDEFQPQDVVGKGLKQIESRWYQLQEITAKVLNNCIHEDHEALAMSFSYMMKELLIVLAYLNGKPYKTLGEYIKKAKTFPIKPKGTDELLRIFVNGEYKHIHVVEKATQEMFGDLEEMLLKKGCRLYFDTLSLD